MINTELEERTSYYYDKFMKLTGETNRHLQGVRLFFSQCRCQGGGHRCARCENLMHFQHYMGLPAYRMAKRLYDINTDIVYYQNFKNEMDAKGVEPDRYYLPKHIQGFIQ